MVYQQIRFYVLVVTIARYLLKQAAYFIKNESFDAYRMFLLWQAGFRDLAFCHLTNFGVWLLLMFDLLSSPSIFSFHCPCHLCLVIRHPYVCTSYLACSLHCREYFYFGSIHLSRGMSNQGSWEYHQDSEQMSSFHWSS